MNEGQAPKKTQEKKHLQQHQEKHDNDYETKKTWHQKKHKRKCKESGREKDQRKAKKSTRKFAKETYPKFKNMWCSFRMVKVKANRAIHGLHSGATVLKPNNNYVYSLCVFQELQSTSLRLKWLGRRWTSEMYFTRHTRTNKLSAVPNVLCWISVLTSKSGLKKSTFHSSKKEVSKTTFHKKNKFQVSSLVFFNPVQTNGCYIVFIQLKQKTACRHLWILVPVFHWV